MQSKPARALRRFCMDCQGGYSASVQDCQDLSCQLYIYRLCTLQPLPDDARPLRAIRRHCLFCAGSRQDVRACDAGQDCALWSFRFGVSPATFKRVVVRRQRWRTELTLPGLPR